MKSQRLCRIATVSSKCEPEVSPVGFQIDRGYLYVGSHSQDIFPNTKRYRNITSGNNRVSVLIDDLASVDPWRPRGIRIQGRAEVVDHEGMFGKGKYFRITPAVSVSWGIDPGQGSPGSMFSRKVHNR
jgi:pyridoxamine 5'-phosphate oxidase family protein